MMGEQQKRTSIERLVLAINILTDQQDSIMMNGNITPQLWDEILHPDVLGSLCPTMVIAKALIAQIRLIEDQLLSETILFYFSSGTTPRKTKALNAKEWFDVLKQQCTKSPLIPSSVDAEQTDNSSIASSVATFMDKMKIDVKLPIYDGTPDTCTDCFFSLEKNLERMRVSRSDYLFYASGHTVGMAK